MLSSIPAADGNTGSSDKRKIGGSAIHVPGFADLIEQLVRSNQAEIGKHDFGHGPHATHGSAKG